MDNLPKPFGYVRDGGDPYVFQHAPFSTLELMMCSTTPVYSYAQMRDAIQASRKQALNEARGAVVCEQLRITENQGGYLSAIDRIRDSALTYAIAAIRSLEGNATKETT